MLQFLATINWTAVILTTIGCVTATKCLSLSVQLTRILRDIARTCRDMEAMRQEGKIEKKEKEGFRCAK